MMKADIKYIIDQDTALLLKKLIGGMSSYDLADCGFNPSECEKIKQIYAEVKE